MSSFSFSVGTVFSSTTGYVNKLNEKMDFGFCDLCVNGHENKLDLKEILFQLHNVGYSTVVINQNVDESVFDNEKKKKKKVEETETTVSSLPQLIDLQDLEEEFKGKLNILKRITFSFSDPVKTHSLNQLPILRKYNLYAVIPKNQNAFQYACSQLNADIIYINSTSSGIKLNRKLYLQATERGIHFEIQYSDIIKTFSRKFAIHYSHLFYTFGKSRNVIISSGANDKSLIRNPYDVINLARLLGLNQAKAKYAVHQQAHQVLLKGEGRRCGKALFKIQHNKRNISKEDDTASGGANVKKIKSKNN